MEFLREHQLSIMLFMSGGCGILVLATLMSRVLTGKRKTILALMEAATMLLLLFDRWAYLYRGDISDFGFLMTRLSNGLVFFLLLLLPFLVTHYMQDMYRNEGGMAQLPRRLALCNLLFLAGVVLLVISQFTDLYYTIDARNIYHRAPGFTLSHVFPFLMIVLQESVILQYYGLLGKKFERALAVSIALPTAAAVVQVFAYGLSLTNMTMVIVVIIFFVYALNDLHNKAEQAQIHEVEFYKKAQQREQALFEQTTEALANAIDAKDKYTRGHSARVAALSRQIAEAAGLSGEECSRIYFAALLHDVGKIGIRYEVINKTGRLTDEEFEQIKTHPVLGYQILSSIRQSPYLSEGAHYHHERYDGKGYPDGLAGEEIPRIARIIAVADAYDAMTSNRSYRNSLPPEKVRGEIVRGMGTQFDPRYAEIMLRIA